VEQTAPTLASKTCLVIDDDPDFAAFVQKVAQGAGLKARVLTDPSLVEQSLEASDPDVITLDMDMRGRNGLAVLEELAVRGLDERVIIISGNPPPFVGRTRPQVRRLHVHAVLTKPIRKRDLEFALVTALEGAAH